LQFAGLFGAKFMKKPILFMLVAATVSQVLAGEAASGVDRLVACAEVRNAQDRLACFDREVAPLAHARSAGSGALGPQSTPSASPSPAMPLPSRTAEATRPPPAAPAAPSFGNEQLAPKSKTSAAEVEQEMHAKIDRLRAAGSGFWLVYLDNGQVWRHEDERLGGYLRQGEAITISKASLGSYRLSRDAGDDKNWIRVTRVR
jgi:hypothetical protein